MDADCECMMPTRKFKPAKSSFEHVVKQKKIDERERQLGIAVQYCREHNCRGYAAISAGVCPLIKDNRTINRRLDDTITTGKEKEYCKILTEDEEDLLVRYIKNKRLSYQPANRQDLNDVIIKMLKLRSAANKKSYGRRYIRLSDAAKAAIRNETVGQSFWQRFDAKHPELTRKRVSHVPLKRVLACTEEMAISHIDALAEELISVVVLCHVIFRVKKSGINSTMVTPSAVENTPNLLVSATENGVQDGKLCFEAYKFFDQKIQGIEKPVVSLTDGHSSRYNLDVLRFCRRAEVNQFMAPPDSTHVTQLLDQVNAALHQRYRACAKELFHDNAIDREGLLDILAKLCPTWIYN